MELFRIADGRAWFYQWDLDQQILVNDPDIQEVHFCNGTTDCSLVVEVKEGAANVPNILLQQARNIKIYAMQAGHTCGERILIVRPRTKPADYVYTETEVKRYEDLQKQIEEVRKSIPSVPVQSVNGKTGEVNLRPSDVGAQPAGDYALRSEIPSVPVKSVNGKTGEVKLSASDVGALPSDTPIPGAYTLPTASAEVKGGVKVGNRLRMNGEALEVVPEGEYELIETITIEEDMEIERTEEPDGTPYAFNAFAIRFRNNSGTKLAAIPNLIYTTNSTLSCYTLETQGTGDVFCTIELIKDKGRWVFSRSPWGLSTAANNLQHNMPRSFSNKPNKNDVITGFNSQLLIVAGVTMEIWGVRANA